MIDIERMRRDGDEFAKVSDRAHRIMLCFSIFFAVAMFGLGLKDRSWSEFLMGVSFTALAFAATAGQRATLHTRKMRDSALDAMQKATETIVHFEGLAAEGSKLRAEAEHLMQVAKEKNAEAEIKLDAARRIQVATQNTIAAHRDKL